ncbi:MAG: BatD family protein [Candidatus Omnitrophota bacterium]
MKNFKQAWIPLLLVLSLSTAAQAQDENCKALLDKDRIRVYESSILSIIFYELENIQAPQLPQIKGFDSRHLNSLRIVEKQNYLPVKAVKHRYALIAKAEGRFMIEPMTFEIDGRTFKTAALNIEVLPPLQPDTTQAASQKKTPAKALQEGVLVRIIPEKTDLYLNQQVGIEVRLYVDKKKISLTDVEYPILQHSNISIGKFSEPERIQQTVGGEIHDVLVFKSTIFPMKSGEFALGPAEVKCNLLTRKEKEALAASGAITDSGYEYVKSPAGFSSSTVMISVLDFPDTDRPVGFSNAVGEFNFTAEPDSKQVKVGSVLTLTMKISGSGNLGMITAPAVTADGFKIYQPEVQVKNDIKVFTQILIPEKSGTLNIDRINFSFFNPDEKTYRQVYQGPFQIKVFEAEEPLPAINAPTPQLIPGEVAAYSLKEDLGKDIVYIKDNIGKLNRKTAHFYNNKLFYVIQALPFVIFMGIFLVHRHRTRLKQDEGYARYVKAFKHSKKNLSKAKGFLNPKTKEQFYSLIFTALQQYLGDKFYIPAGGITIKTIDEIAASGRLSENIIKLLKQCFSDCDRVRFVPLEFDKNEMVDIFKNVSLAIDSIEKSFKKPVKIKQLILIAAAAALALSLLQAETYAQDTKAESFAYAKFIKANSLYQQEKFEQSIAEYEDIAGAGFESANVYYNLGNAYFKIGSVGRAVLNYERAKRLAPGDEDLRTNLEYAKSLIVDKSMQETAPWFIKAVNTIPERFSADGFCALILLVNILVFVLLTLSLFRMRATRFFTFIIATLVIIYIGSFAVLIRKVSVINNNQEAIMLVPETDCRFGPLDNATTHFKLYEGSKIMILKSEGPWSKIKRFDGKIGWVKKDFYEVL